MSYNGLLNQRKTVVLPMPGRTDMVANNAGGYTFAVDAWTKLRRFLILGTDKGTYYASEGRLNMESTKDIVELIKTSTADDDTGIKIAQLAIDISVAGRAKNNDYALYVMALVMSHGSSAAKRFVAQNLSTVARTGTHLMHFVGFANSLRGWGKALKTAVQNWYSDKPVDNLAYGMIKYQSRDGWSQRDILRMAHPHAQGDVMRNALYRYVTRGKEAVEKDGMRLPAIIEAFERAKTADEKTLVKLIVDNRMSHEMIPNEMKNSPAVWEALYPSMGTTAVIRNLNKLTAVGLLKPLSQMTKSVVEKLTSEDELVKGRIHPLTMLIAQRQYAQGRGDKGSLTWIPVPQVVDALESGFYTSFKSVEPSGKNMLLALDVSGSMTSYSCVGAPLMCAEGTAVMAMVTKRREVNSHIVGFAGGIVDLGINASDTLATAISKVHKSNFGTTNPGAAIQYAITNKLDVDLFSVYTDNEVNTGTHPSAMLNKYRKEQGKPEARMAVIGMAVNGFTLADPKDPLQMDLVGFDSNTPRMLSDFAAGLL